MKYIGVTKIKTGDYWQAAYKKKYLGCMDTAEQAALLVDTYILETVGTNAYFQLNFPERVRRPDTLVCDFCGPQPIHAFRQPGKRYRTLVCEQCIKSKRKAVYEDQVKSQGEGPSRAMLYRTSCIKTRLNYLIYSARTRAKKYNLEFDLDLAFLSVLLEKQSNKCALSGVDFVYNVGTGYEPFAMSIDKIDPKKGYTKDNVQLLARVVNTMKTDLAQEDFIKLCSAICARS